MGEGLAALFGSAFLGHAILPIMIKLGTNALPPFIFSSLRFFASAALCIPFVFAQKNIIRTRREWIFLLFLSLFCAGDAFFFSIGILYTATIISQIIYAADPLMVVVLSYLLFREKPDRYKVGGLVIACIGLGLLFQKSFGKNMLLTFGTPVGNIYMLCGSLSWALYLIFSKKLNQRISVVTTAFTNSMISAIVFTCAIPIEYFFLHHSLAWTPFSWFAILLTGSATSGMYLLVQIGIKKTSAFTASLFQYLGPLLTAITAVPILGEKPTLQLIFGGCLILAGVFFATTYPILKENTRKNL